jgi:hypothetical protein
MAVREAPTGFMLIKRHVFDHLRRVHPELAYKPDMIGSIDPSLYYRFFDVSVDPETGRYLSEDYTFCRRWEAMGGKVYVDANSNLAHQGGKIYRGDVAGSLSRDVRYAVTAPVGMCYVVNGLGFLKPNPPCAV